MTFGLRLGVDLYGLVNIIGTDCNQAYSEYKHVLADISHSRYVAITTKPDHRLQIRATVHAQLRGIP